MGLTIDDRDVAYGPTAQSRFFQADVEALAGEEGNTGVISGCAVSQRGAGANMSVDVAIGIVLSAGSFLSITSVTNVVISAAHASLDRLDVIVVNASGTPTVRTGTASATPKPDSYGNAGLTAGDVILATVYVPAGTTSITDSAPKLITDKRGFLMITPGVSSDSGPIRNLLINGGFDFFQRQDPTTLTSVADDVYCADRWYALTQTAAVQAVRTSGDVSLYAGQLKQNQAGAQRMGIAQIVEGVDSVATRSKLVRLKYKAKSSTTPTLRYAILEWTGTIDTVTSDVVNDWTSSTYTAGNFFLGASLTVAAVGSTALTTSFAEITLTASISASCKNLIVFMWTEGTVAQNVTVDICEAMLTVGAASPKWSPRLIGDELALCQRYYEKSYEVDTAPGSVTTVGRFRVIQAANASGYIGDVDQYKVMKRVIPTVSIWDTSGNAGKITRYLNSGIATANVTPSSIPDAGNSRGVDMAHTDGTAGYGGYELQWTASAEL